MIKQSQIDGDSPNNSSIYTLHEIALVLPYKHRAIIFFNGPSLTFQAFFYGKPAEMCCRSLVTSKWLKTQSVGSAGRKYSNFNTSADYKYLAVQRLNNHELEEQFINYFNEIMYLIEGKVRLKGKAKKPFVSG